jgi:glycerophosphoryl diester phosphodiesterase
MSFPLLLGHRGARASRQIPENTLASFELCLQHGCDGFEFDLRRSADGQAVVCHDAVVGGLEIEKSLSAILQLPMLDDVLREFAHRAFLDIELKVAGLDEQVLSAMRRHPPEKGYVVSSFLPDVIDTIHDRDASIPLGFLCETRGQLLGWRETPAQWVIPQADLVDQELVRVVHLEGKKVMVWTVNRADQMNRFVEWGADAIISDETTLASVGVFFKAP